MIALPPISEACWNHDLEGVASGLFTHIRPESYVAADESLERRADRGKDIARAHDDAAHYAEILRDAKSAANAWSPSDATQSIAAD